MPFRFYHGETLGDFCIAIYQPQSIRVHDWCEELFHAAPCCLLPGGPVVELPLVNAKLGIWEEETPIGGEVPPKVVDVKVSVNNDADVSRINSEGPQSSRKLARPGIGRCHRRAATTCVN